MPRWDESAVEKILFGAQRAGYPFEGYRYVTEEGRIKRLGSGSFSRVYELESEEYPERRYALKVIGLEECLVASEKFYSTSFLQRQLGEQTPYVVRILGMCEAAIVLGEEGEVLEIRGFDGRSETLPKGMLLLQFLLMERLACVIEKDKFWNCHLARREVTEAEGILEFAEQIGRAILTAHQNNVLHRDVKLENIFWNGQQECYQLGDFGIAKYVENGNAETVVYTDGYGAPEIERRLLDHYDAKADIYSFGICLYLLLNELRFPGSDGYYVLQVQYDPQFVFPAPLHSFPDMTKLIRRACSFYPEDRFSDMEEMLEEIDRLRKREELAFGEKSRSLRAENTEPEDFETETYRGETRGGMEAASLREAVPRDGRGEGGGLTAEGPGQARSRYQRKEAERRKKEALGRFRMRTTGILTLLVALLLWETPWNGVEKDSFFWIFPAAALVESILLQLKEFHVPFGIVTGLLWAISIGSYEWSAPYIALCIALLRRKGRFAMPVSLGVLLCAVLKAGGMSEQACWIRSHHLFPLLLVLSLVSARLIAVKERSISEEIPFWRVLYEEGRIDFGGNLCLAFGVVLFVYALYTPAYRLNEACLQYHFFTAGILMYLIRSFLWRMAKGRLREES